uniref:Uncharacterized protein n=1 Tax=Solanum lycopersicum TaxID=4081 RepID=A0A3Q7J6W7_SOLLC
MQEPPAGSTNIFYPKNPMQPDRPTSLSNEYHSDFETKELLCYQNIQYFEKISRYICKHTNKIMYINKRKGIKSPLKLSRICKKTP